MVDVFISYPQAERPLMLPIKQRLEALGLVLFVDVDGGLDGESTFPDALDKGVRASKAVLGIWSPLGLTREWVKKECGMGLQANKLVAVERKKLTFDDVPLQFIDVDRKPLTDFEGTAPHEGWAMTLSALATKLRLWVEKRSDLPEAVVVREKISVLDKAAAAERAALEMPTSTTDRMGTSAVAPVQQDYERAWAFIDGSLEPGHYTKFERAFERVPNAFFKVMEAEARAKSLERWAATDKQDPDAITETLRTGLFPALQAVVEQALASAVEAARQRLELMLRKAPPLARKTGGLPKMATLRSYSYLKKTFLESYETHDAECIYLIDQFVSSRLNRDDWDCSRLILHLSADGLEKLREFINIHHNVASRLSMEKKEDLVATASASLVAHHHLKRGRHYQVRGGKIVVLDPWNNNSETGKPFPNGLHQAVQAKEHVEIDELRRLVFEEGKAIS